MELRLAASMELRGDAFAGESAFLLARALASLACSRSFARLVDDARESVVRIAFWLAARAACMLCINCWESFSLLPSPRLFSAASLTHQSLSLLDWPSPSLSSQ